MKNPIKYLISSIVFLLILVFLLAGVSKVLVPVKVNFSGTKDPQAAGIVLEKENTIDVLFIGDSEAYSTFIPLKLWKDYGITSYCCGTSAQKLSETKSLLEKAFKNQSPKIVILETNTIYRKMTITDSLLLKSYLIKQLYDYHNNWKSLVSEKTDSDTLELYNETKGYRYSIAVSPANTKNYMSETEHKKAVSPLNKTFVREIKELIEKNGARLILVSTPSTKNWNMPRHNGITILAEEQNVEYIDMNLLTKDIKINWKKDTRDKGDHLNYPGAVKATDYIGKYLFKTGLLADHRSDSEYFQWDILLNKFNKTIIYDSGYNK